MAAVSLVAAPRNGHASMPASYTRITPHVSHKCSEWDYRRGYGSLMVEGCASTAGIDRHREVLDPSGMTFDSLPLPIVQRHDGREVGQVVWLRRTPYSIFVRGRIFDRESLLWNDIEAQRVCRFSVQAESMRDALHRDCDGVLIHRQWKLKHVAIAGDGAVNPECLFWPLADDEVLR